MQTYRSRRLYASCTRVTHGVRNFEGIFILHIIERGIDIGMMFKFTVIVVAFSKWQIQARVSRLRSGVLVVLVIVIHD